MYELLLNAVKVLVSKDARDAGKDLLTLVQNSPDWKKSICSLELRIDSSSREQTTLIRELSAEKLRALEYPDSVIESFQVIYVELTANALEHGLKNRWYRKGKIEIETRITESYVALLVRNTKGVRFNLEKTCDDQYRLLSDNPQSPRGRGLLTVRELADEFFSLENGRSIKAVLYRDCVSIDFFRLGNLAIFTIVSGLYNPSLATRLQRHVFHYPGHDIILDFSRFKRRCTKVYGEVIALRERLARVNQTVVPIYNPQSEVSLDVGGVESWRQALERLNRLDLLDELAQRGYG